jgi:parvulin-like peptidyl-prolyl isomerase
MRDTRQGWIKQAAQAGGAVALMLVLLAPSLAQTVPGGEVFAVVGAEVIPFAEYQSALAAGMRQKYYHAKPPEAEVARFQRDVGDQLVNQLLLLDEAKRRGIEPDRAKVENTVAGYEERYKDSAQWRANRERLLPGLRQRLERQSQLERFEQAVRAVDAPSEASTRAYYAAHPELFTEPEQVRLSLILLKVDPSSPRAIWEKAGEEAERLHQRLQKGADFAELARLHSADPSAARGGDLGYLHRGMLPEPVQKQVIDTLQAGTVAPPVVLLEGIAIVRLVDRRSAQRRSFEDVRKRAGELWARAQGEAAWQTLITDLRARARIQVDESRFLPLPPT